MDYEFTGYSENMWNIRWQDGFEKEIEGKGIAEQLHCYGWSKFENLTRIPYTELEAHIRAERLENYVEPFQENRLIMQDGLVVGVLVGYYRVKYILPYMGYVYASSSDNNGAGYKEREWSKYLICLPLSHTLWE
ncbi:MAG: hypothetical protein LUH19_08230 [Lachnospiraceae bacterium]|nr:hypothetical protein [Lachnospiraceae bacterium]